MEAIPLVLDESPRRVAELEWSRPFSRGKKMTAGALFSALLSERSMAVALPWQLRQLC